MESDSDDEETFVTLGTPQEVPDKDEPRKKPVSFQDIQAKDNKGRPRFHGAFTGGFSAGYFNTVGTQEGFTPSTFVSSRNDRQKSQTGQRPEDFMDEEDLGEHGIAPRKYVTSGSFASEERRKRRHDEAMLATSDSALLGSTALLNLIVPERITIGVKLLRKMGWKEGQGVGPRLKKQERKKQGYSPCPSVTGGCGFRNAESVVYNAGLWCKTEAGHHQATKVYGCALPPADSDSDIDLDDESLLKDITYAPKDSAHILLNVKDNTKGLGYRGLDPTKALPSTHINLFSNPVMSKKGRKGIRGQAFGVGALEEEDDDIYAVDDMSNYDMTMTAENERDTFGWTGSRNQKQATTPVGYVGKLLEGFKLSSKKLVQKKDFPPPKLPSNFRPIHVFHKSTGQSNISEDRGVDYRKFLKPQDSDHAQASTSNGAQSQGVQRKQTNDSVSRSMALGEQPFVGSVFDLIPEKDKQRMDKARSGVPMDADDSQSDGQQGAVVHASRTEEKSSKSTLSETQNSGQSGSTPAGSGAPLFQGGSLGFKPFSSDSAKQQRYDKYLSLIKQGHKDPYTMVAEAGQTEWEMEKEKEEFSHAARLFKPLATMMAMRFTSAGVEDKLADVKKEEKVELSEPAKAASMKMYGKLTREVMEWHPDKLVCKRFNVPDPFPGSNLVGLASLKRDKYSVFNFLTFSNPTEADRNQQTKTENIEEKEEEKKETTTQNVDRTLKPRQGAAKAAGLKSIFTHLVNPAKQGNRATDPASKGVSFNIKSKVPQKSTEVADVFEDGSKKWDDGAKQMQKPGEDKENNDTKSTEKVGMDLFRAIFRNTDSESSSDDDDDDDHPESKANENKDTRLENSSNSKTNTQGPTNVVENIKMEVESVSNDIIESSNAKRESRENSSNSKQNTQGPTKVVENIKMEVELVSNEVIESSNAMQDQPTQAVLPGSGERIPSIKERLSPDEDSDSYGPALPPGNFAQTANNGNLEAAKSKDSKDTRDMDYIDLTKSSTKKHKHKHKEKHKSKKDKKAKYKKSKHKKKQKKKERKKKDRQMSDTDSSDTTDKDTDEETNVPSDRDLLNKLKQLKPGQRMRASDFM